MKNPNYTFLQAHKRTAQKIFLQGGTRSGKTYAVLMFLIKLCYNYQNAGLVISICRKSMPSLRATAMRDFFELLKEGGLYSEALHFKGENYYILFGNIIEFVNLDDEQKIRGRKRNILFVNEANEVDINTVRQLLFRTKGISIFDYNPSYPPDHWLASMHTEQGAVRLITTYKDNPYLSKLQVQEIERLQETDPDGWQVFGLGNEGLGFKGIVFKKWQEGWDENAKRIAFGLDFGYSPDPLALVEARIAGNSLYLKSHIYRTEVAPSELPKLIKSIVPKGIAVYCDHRPDLIKDLQLAGIHAVNATKDIDAGIRRMLGCSIFVEGNSETLKRELRYYRYKEDANGNPLGGAYIDSMNHAIDAARYATVGLLGLGDKALRTGIGEREKPYTPR